MNPVKDKLNIDMIFPIQVVPEAEQNYRTIKERIRATFHRLPYKAIPRKMVRYLVMDCTHKLNMFPAKGGTSQYYSPRIILGQRVLDYKREVLYHLGHMSKHKPILSRQTAMLHKL